MIPEFPEFKKLELSDKKDVEKFTSKFPPYSDFNFISMWCWNIKDKVKISQLHGNLIVQFSDYLTGEPFYSFLGNNKVDETSESLLDLSKRERIALKLQLMPEESIRKLDSSKFYILESRDHFDYVYHVPDFHKCLGKKYETQRNLFNRFTKKYTDIEIKLLPANSVKSEILELSEKWIINKIGKYDEMKLRNESDAIKRIFDFEGPDLIAVCIFHKGSLIAYTINELLKDNHALCHFAKANTEFSGIYSFLMRKTCESLISFGKEFLNYEQDLGLPHLRFSKSAFQPKVFLTKFSVIRV